MNKTSIEWTHRPGSVGMSWNPIRARRKSDGKVGWACTHASTGCIHCYSETINKRFGTGLPFNVPSLSEVELFVDEKILDQPLRQKNPATIFVGDMFDLFHEAITDDMIARILTVAGAAREHVFQFLTKRAERLQLFMTTHDTLDGFPPKHFWFGVSVENQKYADERIPLLLQTPAAVRFISAEPLLEPIDITPYLGRLEHVDFKDGINWVICGGESGPGARPFDLAWAESLLNQCRAADVPFFFKQGGSNCFAGGKRLRLSGKGGELFEIPNHLQVREFPECRKLNEESAIA